MFGIGLNEMIIITVIALIVIGPKQLPEVARMLGRLIANFKRATSDLRTAIADEVDSQADLSAIKEMKSVVDSELYDAHHTTQSLFDEGVEEAETEAEAEEKVAKEGVAKEEVAETGKVAATEKKEAPAKLPYDDSGAAASGMPTPPGPTGLEEGQELAGPPPEKDEPASPPRKDTAS